MDNHKLTMPYEEFKNEVWLRVEAGELTTEQAQKLLEEYKETK